MVFVIVVFFVVVVGVMLWDSVCFVDLGGYFGVGFVSVLCVVVWCLLGLVVWMGFVVLCGDFFECEL